jgi:hypothetical protein
MGCELGELRVSCGSIPRAVDGAMGGVVVLPGALLSALSSLPKLVAGGRDASADWAPMEHDDLHEERANNENLWLDWEARRTVVAILVVSCSVIYFPYFAMNALTFGSLMLNSFASADSS